MFEKRLETIAKETEAARPMMTHTGVGPLCALAVVHTLGDPDRFRTKEQAVAFVGLDPLDDSSGERESAIFQNKARVLPGFSWARPRAVLETGV